MFARRVSVRCRRLHWEISPPHRCGGESPDSAGPAHWRKKSFVRPTAGGHKTPVNPQSHPSASEWLCEQPQRVRHVCQKQPAGGCTKSSFLQSPEELKIDFFRLFRHITRGDRVHLLVLILITPLFQLPALCCHKTVSARRKKKPDPSPPRRTDQDLTSIPRSSAVSRNVPA